MATNKLFEAAAEILAAGKGKNAMPPQKLEGEVQVAGGPTPENAKPDDDSHKMNFTSKSATAPATKASDASAKMEEDVEHVTEGLMSHIEVKPAKKGGDSEVLAKHDVHYKGKKIGHIEAYKHGSGMKYGDHHDATGDGTSGHRSMDDAIGSLRQTHADHLKSMKEDVDALFADDATISEDFKVKVSTIFEARVQDRVTQIEEQIESHYASMLEEAVESIKEELTEKINDYVGYIVEEWMEENQIAIEKGIRAELTEDFINGLRNLFAEHYIDVPAEKVDLVDELASKVDELETKLNEEVERSVEYRSALIEAFKEVITHEICEGLTATQVEKIKELAEGVDFSTEEEYRQKLGIIRENYFPSGVKKADATHLNEQVDSEDKVDVTDPIMKSIVQSISKTTRV